MRCFVVRPGKGWSGSVPVGLSLWVGDEPVMGDRVMFLDVPVPAPDVDRIDGRASMDGRTWWLVDAAVDEVFEYQGVRWCRWHSALWDGRKEQIVGGYYWVVREQAER
jgi:hypothetical protein